MSTEKKENINNQIIKDQNNVDDLTLHESNSKNNQNYQIFNIHSSYKSQLKAWNKKYFDPFSRGDRIVFFLNESCIITTIGQLNFFKWFISNKIYKYVKEHYDDIEKNMNSNKQSTRKNKKINSSKSYYRKTKFKNTYQSPHNNIRKIDSLAFNSNQINTSQQLSSNSFKKSAKI